MQVVRQAVVLNVADIFRLILSNDTVGCVVDPLSEMYWLSIAHVFVTVCVYHAFWYAEANSSIDAAVSSAVMFIVCIKCMQLVAEKIRSFSTCVCDERLFCT